MQSVKHKNDSPYLSKLTKSLKIYLLEILGFFSLLTLSEYLIFGDLTGWQIPTPFSYPHPYWIGIVVFALVYGLKEGLTAGIISSALFLYATPDSYSWNPLEWRDVSLLPILFLFGGFLIGLVRSSSLAQQQKLTVDNFKLHQQITELDRRNHHLSQTNLNLEKRIVFRLETFQSIFEIAEQLNKINLDQLYQTIPSLIQKYFRAEKCSFYLMTPEGSLKLQSSYGWKKEDEYPVVFSETSKIKKRFSAFRELDMISMEELQQLEVDAYLAVALITQEGSPLGLVKVEKVKFEHVAPDNLRFLSLLCKWIMQSIVNGLRYAESERRSTFEPRTGLVREKPFWFLSKKIIASAVRQKYEVVLLTLSLNFGPSFSSVEKNVLIHQIGDTIKDLIRIDDEIGIADMGHEYDFLIMMPYTNKEQAKVVQKKSETGILNQLAATNPILMEPDFLTWETFSLEDGSLFLSEIVQNNMFDPIMSE